MFSPEGRAGTATPPRASVLVPVYNSASTLARCLRSACRQTMRDIEIIVADDGSGDGSADLAEALARDDSRIRVIRMGKNGGKPRAMNRMTEEACGDWIAVLDADDAWEPERLAVLIEGAEQAGVDMAADNLLYIDSGVAGEDDGFGRIVRTAFDPMTGDRVVGKADLVATADSFGSFDFGILKPVIRRGFVRAHGLRYHEESRLAEDFAYLMHYMVAGGRTWISARPLYRWTMPFGTLSRQWTSTGAGAWRYDYRQALQANTQFLAEMRTRGETEIVSMLKRRGRQYGVMIHYIDAQKMAANGNRIGAALSLLRHPSTWTLLAARVAGRVARAVRQPAKGAPAAHRPAATV